MLCLILLLQLDCKLKLNLKYFYIRISEILASKLISPSTLLQSLIKQNRFFEAIRLNENYGLKQNSSEFAFQAIESLNKANSY